MCYKCLAKKDSVAFKFCAKCHLLDQEEKRTADRQMAINAKRCTNYWKCSKPATIQGGLCSACYEEYKLKHVPEFRKVVIGVPEARHVQCTNTVQLLEKWVHSLPTKTPEVPREPVAKNEAKLKSLLKIPTDTDHLVNFGNLGRPWETDWYYISQQMDTIPIPIWA